MSEEIKGWKLVPVEPSVDMQDAGCCAVSDRGQARQITYADDHYCYRAMLAAAPTPEPSATCICTFAQRLVGDGCYICNPEYAASMAEPEPSASVGIVPSGRCVHGQIYWSVTPPEGDVYSADQLTTLQAKLEQAEKDKAEMIAMLKNTIPCFATGRNVGIKDALINLVAKYEANEIREGK